MKRGVAQGNPPFEEIWRQICVSHVDGEESSQYLIERCLMRPRCLIDLVNYCRSHAVNLGREKIEIDDIKKGEETYSADLLNNIAFEIRDVLPDAGQILYEFVESPVHLAHSELINVIRQASIKNGIEEKIIDLLLWYGVLGFVRDEGEDTYIYNVSYDIDRLRALIRKKTPGSPVYCINPAFWAALEVKR